MFREFVEASAGTGKTYRIATTVVEQVCQGVPLENILTVTFTEKASDELSGRIRLFLENKKAKLLHANATDEKALICNRIIKSLENFSSSNITTIHGFCLMMLKKFHLSCNLSGNFKILNNTHEGENEFNTLLLHDLSQISGDYFSGISQTLIDSMNQLKDFEKYLKKTVDIYKPNHAEIIPNIKMDDLVNIVADKSISINEKMASTLTAFAGYLREKGIQKRKSSGRLTYDDILEFLESSLGDNPVLAETIAKEYSVLIVDEFQDTDPIQWNIFKSMLEKNSNLSCLIVGDPKQAIYSFRGGDLATYKNAKEILIQNGAKPDSLKKNFRSSARMIEAFNIIFNHNFNFEESQRTWFSDGPIPELEKGYKEGDQPIAPESEICPVFIVDTKDVLEKPENIFAKYCLAEILNIRDKDATIAILIREKRNSEPFEMLFRAAGLEYMFYKKSGLFENTEALQLKALLTGLLDNTEAGLKTALLTEFTEYSVDDFLHENGDEQIYLLYNNWKALLYQSNLGIFFRKVLKESALFARLNKFPDARKRIANYTYLIRMLIEKQMALNLTIPEVIEGFINKTFDDIHDDSHDLEPLQAVSTRVQIMTIHQSKGLEFDYVFIAPALSDFIKTEKNFTVEETGEVPDLKKRYTLTSLFDDKPTTGKSNRSTEFAQKEAERLYYVALTRARQRLYLPVTDISKPNPKKLQDILINPLCKSLVDTARDDLFQLVHARHNDSLPKTFTPEKEELYDYTPLDDSGVSRTKRLISSFTSLAKTRLSVDMVSETENDSTLEPGATWEYPYQILPPGIHTGLILHEILENIEFSIIADMKTAENLKQFPNFNELVDKYMEKYLPATDKHFSYSKEQNSVKESITEIIFDTCKTQLKPGNFCLASLPSEKIIKECSFLSETVIPGLENPGGKDIIQGSIDLAFEHEGKVFIADYKTNILHLDNPNPMHFRDHAFSHYGLQMYLYSDAMLKFMESLGTNRKSLTFGGIFYLYLRYLKNYQGSIVFITLDELEKKMGKNSQ